MAYWTFIPCINVSCLFIILTNQHLVCLLYLIFPAKKKVFVFWGCFSTIINFLVGTHLVCPCCGVVPGNEIGSAQHTRLLAASADVRLVLKYFSSTKERAPDATVGMQRTSSVPYTYYTVWYMFDGCETYFWPHLILKIRVKSKFSRAMGDMVAKYNSC